MSDKVIKIDEEPPKLNKARRIKVREEGRDSRQ